MRNHKFQSVVFKPWVGEQYCGLDERLLILGESHYGEHDANLTIAIIKEQLSGVRRPFITKIASVISGAPSSEVDQIKLYGRVAFYNYVQNLLPDRGTKPNYSDFRSSEGAFREILLALKPTKIIATGWRLYDGTPSCWSDGSRAWTSRGTLQRSGKTMAVGDFHAEGHSFRAGFISHPASYGFNPTAWQPVVAHFLKPAEEEE